MSIRSTISALLASTRKAGQAVQDIQVQARTMRDQREALQRKRDALRARPAHLGDLKAMTAAFIREQRSIYVARLTENLAPFARNPENIRSATQRRRLLTLVGISAPDAGHINATAQDVDGVLCALFGEQLVTAMNGALDECKFPEGGVSLVDRDRELAALDEQIHAVNSELQQAIEEANAAGIVITFED